MLTPGASSRIVTPTGAAPSVPRARAFTLSPRALRLAFVNAAVGVAALIWLLPSPWGGLVPVALLAQFVWVRQGSLATLVGLGAGSALGAGLGALLGIEDWRRAAVALLLLLLPAMAAWPSREDSALR